MLKWYNNGKPVYKTATIEATSKRGNNYFRWLEGYLLNNFKD